MLGERLQSKFKISFLIRVSKILNAEELQGFFTNYSCPVYTGESKHEIVLNSKGINGV